MTRKRRGGSLHSLDRRWLFGAVGILVLLSITINCSLDQTLNPVQAGSVQPISSEEATAQAAEEPQIQPAEGALEGNSAAEENNTSVLSEQLWADVTNADISTPRPAHDTSGRISLNVKDAELLDVLSMLAYKLNANIIFLAEPAKVTLKTEALSPLATFQLVLQKEDLDYLSIGNNYIVGERGRLYDDFANRMFLTRFNLFYVSATAMENYISELGMPLESLSVDSNQKALWMQGTPMTLGKARELINTLDVMENASFAEGGARKIRMPVATATGNRAEEELEALIDLLSILLDGFRDGRTDMGWVTWDHPDPVPSIYMDWESPIIKPYDIKMKVTRDFANDYSDQIRYLIAEGTPDNIGLVSQMISAISGAPSTPFSFGEFEDLETESSNTVQWIPDNQQQGGSTAHYYDISISGVPAYGGSLSGGGSHPEGAYVTVTATPSENYEFVRWIENGAEISTSKAYSFSVYGSRNLEAVFVSKNSSSVPSVGEAAAGDNAVVEEED